MIIPGFGMVSHVISTFSGKPVFGYFKIQSSPYYNNFHLGYNNVTHYVREGQINIYNTKYVNLIILVVLVIICRLLYNPKVTNAQEIINSLVNTSSMLVGTSETVCVLSGILVKKGDDDLKIRQWVSGLIDGDGNFHVSKKGYVELSVVIETRDIACLYKLKQRFGGSVKSTSHAKAVRFRLHHKAGINLVINDINGLLQNPVRVAQLERICTLYNILVIPNKLLEYSSAYLSGLFDRDGSVYYNKSSNQVFITVSQKGRYLLDLLTSVYGGTVYSRHSTGFKWVISKKAEVINLIDNYFHWNSCVSAKNKKYGIVKHFYYLSSVGALKAEPDTPLGKSFNTFVERWESTNLRDNR